MKVKTNVKGGRRYVFNHNETMVRTSARPKALKVKTGIKAGRIFIYPPRH